MKSNIIGEHFRKTGELSRGGFGQTFLAEDLRFENTPKCVIKQLKPQSDDPKIISLAGRLFKQEAELLYQLGKHDQIPALIRHFEESGEFYLVQEYIEGITLAEELYTGKVFNQTEVYQLISQLLEVLAYVHRQGVIHRDIKPSNLIRRSSDYKIVLIDFGAVKQVSIRSDGSNQTTQGTVAIGSDGFMPMEQLAGHPKFASDVYAVGMFAIQLLTQTHPTQLIQNQRTGEWIWQDKVSVNPHFAEILNKMMRLDYRQRFPNAGEALNELKKFNFQKTAPIPLVWKESPPNKPDIGLTQITYTPAIVSFEESKNATKYGEISPTIVENIYVSPQNKMPLKTYRTFQPSPSKPILPPPEKAKSGDLFQKHPVSLKMTAFLIWYGFLLVLLTFGISLIWRWSLSF